MSIHKRRIDQLIKRKPVVIAARILLIIILAIIIAAAGSCLRSAEAAGSYGKGAEILTVEEINLMAAAMELENGMNSDLCILLTGSVILSRRSSPEWPDTVQGVLLQKGQYAQHTVRNLYKVKVSDRVMCLALKLATHRPLDPEIVFQSQYKNLGKIKYIVDGEYFATEK